MEQPNGVRLASSPYRQTKASRSLKEERPVVLGKELNGQDGRGFNRAETEAEHSVGDRCGRVEEALPVCANASRRGVRGDGGRPRHSSLLKSSLTGLRPQRPRDPMPTSFGGVVLTQGPHAHVSRVHR